LRKRLDELAPDAREQIRQEKRSQLKPEELAAIDVPYEQRTPEQQQLAYPIEDKVAVSHLEVGQRAPEDKRLEALNVADELTRAEDYAQGVQRYRSVVNFDYWRDRCEMERTDDALQAHELVYRAKQKLKDNIDLVGAKKDIEDGLGYWKKLLEKFPTLLEDRTTGEELAAVLADYREILDAADETMPEDPLWQQVLSRYGKQEPDAEADHEH
jgi:hypothetical protein